MTTSNDIQKTTLELIERDVVNRFIWEAFGQEPDPKSLYGQSLDKLAKAVQENYTIPEDVKKYFEKHSKDNPEEYKNVTQNKSNPQDQLNPEPEDFSKNKQEEDLKKYLKELLIRYGIEEDLLTYFDALERKGIVSLDLLKKSTQADILGAFKDTKYPMHAHLLWVKVKNEKEEEEYNKKLQAALTTYSILKALAKSDENATVYNRSK